MKKYVYGSPSTQDWNRYYGGLGNEEHHLRMIMTPAAALVRAAGHDVKLGGTISARTNADDANAWFRSLAKAAGAKDTVAWIRANCLYVAGHSNAGGGEGTEGWFFTGSAAGEKLAAAIYERVRLVSASPDRGLKHSTGYIELKRPIAPATIIEIAFHDDPEDALEIVAEHDQYAAAIAQGVLDVAGGAIAAPKPAPAKKPVRPVLRKGKTGRDIVDDIELLQRRLNQLQMRDQKGKALVVDRDFGDKTEYAVKRFQRAYKVAGGPDGVVGANTWAALGY